MPITKITGPFCVEVADAYIAHETDTAELPVPILMEDGTDVILPENASGTSGDTECIDGEPICCNEPMYINFDTVSKTEIPYTQAMVDQFGLYPKITVWYFDADASLFRSSEGVLTRTHFVGKPPTKIVIDHGGPSTGFIKIV